MRSWKTPDLDTQPRRPEILASTDDTRVIMLALPSGESLDDHQVHERVWMVLVSGEVEVTSLEPGDDASVTGGPGLLVEFEPGERHRVDAVADSRFLLILTPWPGDGHPGAMSVEEKAQVRERAAERNSA